MEEEVKVNNDSYSCPECSAPMHFDPETTSLKCDYCGKIIKLQEESTDEEFDFNDADDKSSNWDSTHVVKCQACGAENVVSTKEFSIICPFCGSNQVVDTDELAGLKPNRVVPFKLTDKDAGSAYQKFVKKKLLCPGKVKKLAMDLKINGVYIPSWTYDTNTFSRYNGRLGEHYTVTVGSGKNRRTEVRTRYFRVSGTINKFFDDVVVNAGKSISQGELKNIEPYDTNNSNVYDDKYLAGFGAEHYSLPLKQGFNVAKEEMKGEIRSSILSRYTYDVVDYLNVDTAYSDITYKYVLLPTWIGLFNTTKKSYRFVVNGASGKVTGKYPKSAIRISILVLLIIMLAVAVIIFFLKYGE